MKTNAGFTLIELVVVIIIVGILAVSAVSRVANDNNFELVVTREGLISALSQAQQLAMQGQPTQFEISNSAAVCGAAGVSCYRIRIGAPLANFDLGGVSYPQLIESDLSVVPANLILDYDAMGNTTSTLITINSPDVGAETVCVRASGYAHSGSCS